MEGSRTFHIASVKEARQALDRMNALAGKVSQVEGLSGGELEGIYNSIKNILNEYTDASRRQYRALLRDLGNLAAKVAELYDDGLLSKKHTRLFDVALSKMRIRDFYSARRIIRKFDDLIEMKKEMLFLLNEYRRFYHHLENEISSFKRKLEKMRRTPKPAMSQEKVGGVRDVLAQTSDSIKHVLTDYMSTCPSQDVLRTMLSLGKLPDLNVPRPSNPQAAEELVVVLTAYDDIRQRFGERSLAVLIDAVEYTDAYFSHIIKDHRSLKRLLIENKTWLKLLYSPEGYSPRFTLEQDAAILRAQVGSWTKLMKSLPSGAEGAERLGRISAILDSGEFESAQSSQRLYKEYGALALMRWSGKLERSIEETEDDLARFEKDLDRLPHPDEAFPG